MLPHKLSYEHTAILAATFRRPGYSSLQFLSRTLIPSKDHKQCPLVSTDPLIASSLECQAYLSTTPRSSNYKRIIIYDCLVQIKFTSGKLTCSSFSVETNCYYKIKMHVNNFMTQPIPELELF